MVGRTAGPIRLGELTPATTTVEVIRGGQPVQLQAYVYGPRCPLRVKAEIAAAHDALIAALDDATHKSEARGVALGAYYRDAALALVEGLEEREADLLAGDFDAIQALLRRLAFLQDQPADEDDDDAGEAAGEATSTGASSSPTSVASTADAPSNG